MSATPPARILLIDDEEALLELITAILTPLGFDLHATTSAGQALHLLATQRFDLVISDLVMPGVDGQDLLEVMRARGDQTAVLFLSGSGAVPVVVKLMRSGASGFLEKPFDGAELKREVLSLLQEARSKRSAREALEASSTRLAVPMEIIMPAASMGVGLPPPRSTLPTIPATPRRTHPPPTPSQAPTPVSGRGPMPASGRPTDRPNDVPPSRLGRYTLLEELATGGMGKVFRANDPTLHRDVALKVIVAPASATEREEFVKRFRREAVALAKLRHPHIVAVFDCGVDEATHLPYLVMELLTGRPLGEITANAMPLPLTRALHIAHQLADALAFAHEHGIVHRDIKPDNVLIDPNDDVHLIDFGVASVDDVEHQSAHFVVGTPSYLSPEAATSGVVDWRADQFSLATLILELLTGRSVFRGTGLMETVLNVKDGRAPTLHELGRDDVPPELEELLVRMHQKRPEDRFQGERNVASALRDILGRLQAPPHPANEPS